jgi:ankyrin repeat protein
MIQLHYLFVYTGWTPLHEAANHGHYHLAQLLIKFGANVMATGLDDMTPLHDAASFGNQKLVKMLIEKGADPLFKNKKGKSPQDIAHPSLAHFFSSFITGEKIITNNICESINY